MAYAAGRDDVSEQLGIKLDRQKTAKDTFIVFMQLGVQAATLMDSGRAMAEVTAERGAQPQQPVTSQTPSKRKI